MFIWVIFVCYLNLFDSLNHLCVTKMQKHKHKKGASFSHYCIYHTKNILHQSKD